MPPAIAPLRIESPDGSHYAVLEDDPAGVRITVWRAATTLVAGKRLDQWIIDCCWHLACDRVHDILQTVRRDGT